MKKVAVNRVLQRSFERRVDLAKNAGKYNVRHLGNGRSLVRGKKLAISASKSEDKAPRHYQIARSKRRAKR
jgi:hypothetical protein